MSRPAPPPHVGLCARRSGTRYLVEVFLYTTGSKGVEKDQPSSYVRLLHSIHADDKQQHKVRVAKKKKERKERTNITATATNSVYFANDDDNCNKTFLHMLYCVPHRQFIGTFRGGYTTPTYCNPSSQGSLWDLFNTHRR